jgi:hypothetical protein
VSCQRITLPLPYGHGSENHFGKPLRIQNRDREGAADYRRLSLDIVVERSVRRGSDVVSTSADSRFFSFV